jgi:hypothetical protein
MPGDVILALVGYTDERRHGLFARSDTRRLRARVLVVWP